MSHITPGHVQAFQMVRSPHYDNITLASCRVNGEPAVAIVMSEFVGEGKVGVMPLFVSITERMKLEFAGLAERQRGAGRGPKHPAAAFHVNKESVTEPQ
jgi:hypothetical protein